MLHTNSHAICNAHEAVARTLVEEIIQCDLNEAEMLDPAVIDQAIELATVAGFSNVVEDIRTLAEELNFRP